MINSYSIALIVILACPLNLMAANSKEESCETENDTEYVQWAFPIAMPETDDEKMQEIADDLRQKLHSPLDLLKTPKNPTCALWLEISNWQPQPSQGWYLVVIQKGGGTVSASDHEQLKLAVEHLKKLTREVKGHAELPVGLLTNFPLIEPLKSGKGK